MTYAREARRLAKESGDAREASRQSFRLGILCHQRSDWEKAIDALKEAIAGSNHEDDPEMVLACFGMLGDSWTQIKNCDEALRAFGDQLALVRRVSRLEEQ